MHSFLGIIFKPIRMHEAHDEYSNDVNQFIISGNWRQMLATENKICIFNIVMRVVVIAVGMMPTLNLCDLLSTEHSLRSELFLFLGFLEFQWVVMAFEQTNVQSIR